MIRSILNFFEKNLTLSGKENGISDHSLMIATAALLVEMMKADLKTGERELEAAAVALRKKFGLTAGETETLIYLAEREAAKSTSYHEFTSLINKGFSLEERIKVVEYLWEVAFADGVLDEYEEHMVRKIADLLYVPHREFINTKLRVRDSGKKGMNKP